MSSEITGLRAIPVTLIDATNRLRPTDPAWVDALAADMSGAGGLIEPIIVRPVGGRFELVAGAHRLEAAQLLGWETIDAIVRVMDDLTARLAEIDENLIRRELSPLDRAVFLSERKSVHEVMFPETAHGGDRKSLTNKGGNQVANLATRFSEETAARIGLSERTIWRAVGLVHKLGLDRLGRLRGTAIAENQSELEVLAKLDAKTIDEVVAKFETGTAKRLSDALPRAAVVAPDLTPKLIEIWSRANARERRRFLDHLGIEGPAAEKAATAKPKKG